MSTIYTSIGSISGLSSIYLKQTGGTVTGTIDMGANRLQTTYSATASNDVINKYYLDTTLPNYVGINGTTYIGACDLSNTTTAAYFSLNNNVGASLFKVINSGIITMTQPQTSRAPTTGNDLINLTYFNNNIIQRTGTTTGINNIVQINPGGSTQVQTNTGTYLMLLDNTGDIFFNSKAGRTTLFSNNEDPIIYMTTQTTSFKLMEFVGQGITRGLKFSYNTQNYIYNNGTDGTGTNSNLFISAWSGVGFKSEYTGDTSSWSNTRTGDWFMRGALNVNTIYGYSNGTNYIALSKDKGTGNGLYNWIRCSSSAGNELGPSSWGKNYTVFSSQVVGANTGGLGISSDGGSSMIASLTPGSSWQPLYIGGNPIYACHNGPTVSTTNGGGWSNVSDEKIKKNIKPLSTLKSLNKILSLKTIVYNRISNAPMFDNDNNIPLIGFVAQEVEKVTPYACNKIHCKEDGELLGVSYQDLFIHNIGASQEIYKIIQQQNTVIQQQQNLIINLQNQIDVINQNMLSHNNLLSKIVDALNKLN